MLSRFRNIWLQLKGAGRAAIAALKGLEELKKTLLAMQKQLSEAAAKVSESEERVLFTMIGMALTTWARMEEGLVLLIELLLGVTQQKAGLVMYSIINFNVWLSIIDELFTLEPRLTAFKPRWNKISERIRKIKDTRDRLAHDTSHAESSGAAPPTRSLRPSLYDYRQKSRRYKPLTYTEISTFTAAVADIAEDLITLAQDMVAALKASSEKSPG